MTDDLRYPVGKFRSTTALDDAERAKALDALTELPRVLAAAVSGLNDSQLDMPYRPGGWTVRQVVHHVADSHLNAYVRLRLALTEDTPTIKPYAEAAWAELPDARTMPVSASLRMLDALHARWVALLRALAPADYARAVTHPDNGRMTIDTIVALYSWHGRHHTAHITSLRTREGWT